MGQPSSVLRSATGALLHWCPGCERMHVVPIGEPYNVHWTYNGDAEKPTFSPSVKHTLPDDRVCHYFIRDGRIEFCGDSSHALAGQTVPLPPLPPHARDDGDAS